MRSGCGWVIASEALITRRRQMRSAREAVRAGAELHLPMDASYGFLFRELYRGDVDVCTYPTYTLEEKGKGAISKGLKRSLLSSLGGSGWNPPPGIIFSATESFTGSHPSLPSSPLASAPCPGAEHEICSSFLYSFCRVCIVRCPRCVFGI
ncbi:hypothetical protein B296_00057173 [Ensete ventricosum]|uniref:Uncharacterized protein n=1 Tax=Ensete ventricosum TaxID=4639 RepID=A0A426XAX8_ENSVE|nr:hypothetical protein B296_00057173 [Ensete ventricosum]